MYVLQFKINLKYLQEIKLSGRRNTILKYMLEKKDRIKARAIWKLRKHKTASVIIRDTNWFTYFERLRFY